MATDFDPSKFAAAQLYSHILQKGFQAGSLLGVGIGAPVLAALAKRKGAPVDAYLVLNAAAYGSLGFTGLSALLGAAKFTQIDQEGFEDRVYRLHYNAGQQRTDTFAQVGALAGIAVGALYLKQSSATGYLGSAAIGTALGVLAHLATRPAEVKAPNKMLHELKN